MTLSLATQNRIVGMHEGNPEISYAAIGRALEVSRQTVSNVVKRFRDRGTVEIRNSPGRPRKLSARDERAVVNASKRDRRIAIGTIAQSLALDVGRATIRRTLRRRGIFSRIAVVKPFLSEGHKRARLAFARQYVDRPFEY